MREGAELVGVSYIVSRFVFWLCLFPPGNVFFTRVRDSSIRVKPLLSFISPAIHKVVHVLCIF
jgi:hypothetical protein